MTYLERGYRENAWGITERFSLTPIAAAILLSVIILVLTLAMRGPLPIDETRYLTVAWEMWRSGDLLVPHLNGAPYSHKPPMMFWLINAAWELAGPHERVARAVPGAFSVVCVFLTWRLGAELGDREAGGRAALILATMTVFALFGAATMFDAMLTAATIAGLIGLVRVARGGATRGWAIFGASIAFGILSKGPVILVHLLPAALLAPLWLPSPPVRWSRWYLGLLVAIMGGAAIPLAWAIPAAISGGPEFGSLLLWQQTAGRMVNSFAHKRPFWFYVVLIPALMFPWTVSPRFWTGWRSAQLWRHRVWRLPAIMIAGSFVMLSLVSGKQIHYLLPILPAAALLIARKVGDGKAGAIEEKAFPLVAAGAGVALLLAAEFAHRLPDWVPPLHSAPGLLLLLSAVPLWRLRKSTWQVIPATAMMIAVALLLECGHGALTAYDLRPIAGPIDRSRPIAFVGGYEGEIGFAARLTRPVEVVTAKDAAAWRATHRNGYLVARYKSSRPDFGGGSVIEHPYMRGRIGLWAPPGPD